MSSRPARSPEIFQSLETVFIKHYDWLINWGLHFTNNDRARAEDLVQEVFSQFAFTHTDLSSVENIQSYLYSTLRNTHVSAIRLACRSHAQAQSIVEYSMADKAVDASDPYSLYQTQDELRRVCQYACVRKQSSRAGSVLILRYFFGYHLSEVAAVLGGTSQAIRQSLRFARNEARLFLDNPGALKFIDRNQTVNMDFLPTVCAAGELLAKLRVAIFRSCQGECLSNASLRDLYAKGYIVKADNLTLAHIVSCPRCLDAVNRELGLPMLAQRHPADALGPDNNRRGQGGGQNGSGRSGGNAIRLLRRTKVPQKEISSTFMLQCQRRATELFEHYPTELLVSANGHVLGSQTVTSETSRLRLDITINEPLGFIEVMSQENARLLVMTVEPPPEGEPTQARRVALSEGRYLEATLRHGYPWPMLEVVYHDPSFSADTQIATTELDRMWEARSQALDLRSLEAIKSARLFDIFSNVDLLYRPFWTRPSFMTALILVLLVAAFLFVHFRVTPAPTASGLLEQAAGAESRPAGASDLASYRVINLEERNAQGQVIARNRIEVWRDVTRNLSARRVYDEAGRLVAGEWTTGGMDRGQQSSRTIYHHKRIEIQTRNLQDAIRDREFWQIDPSAKDYAELVAQINVAHVNDHPDVYVIEHVDSQPAADSVLQQATLTIRKSDLHAIEQTLTFNLGNEMRQFRFIETRFDRPSIRTIAPATFEIDPEVLSGRVTQENATAKGEDNALHPSSSSSLKPVTVAASAELEIEVASLLDPFRTKFGDQLRLTKATDGTLKVQGIVETEQVRNEIVQALSPVLHNPAVRVELSTANEVLARQERQRSNPSIVREFAGSDDAIAVDADLRRYYSRPGMLRGDSTTGGALLSDEAVDQAVRVFAARLVGHSRRALSHAVELKQLSGRFSSTELDTLSPSARARWYTLVRNHAEALRRETSLLSEELQPIFFSNLNRGDVAVESVRDADLAPMIARLHKVVLANDEVIRSGFASGASNGQAVKTPHFWVSLITVERLAERVLRMTANN